MTSSHNEVQLRHSASVREVQTEDGAVLLDMNQGICLSMTPVAVEIWQMLKQNLVPTTIIETLSQRFPDVSIEQISQDVNQFLATLEAKGLVGKTHSGSHGPLLKLLAAWHRRRSRSVFEGRPSGAPRFLGLKAFLGLLAYDFFRFGNNFTQIRGLVQTWSAAHILAMPETVQRVCKAVDYACVWYPKHVLCLQRSLVTTCLLRSCGVSAQMVVGAQKVPFKAHAWTEVAGSAVNERRNVQRDYQLWDRW